MMRVRNTISSVVAALGILLAGVSPVRATETPIKGSFWYIIDSITETSTDAEAVIWVTLPPVWHGQEVGLRAPLPNRWCRVGLAMRIHGEDAVGRDGEGQGLAGLNPIAGRDFPSFPEVTGRVRAGALGGPRSTAFGSGPVFRADRPGLRRR